MLASLSAKDILRPVKTRPGVVCSSQMSHGRHHHVDDNVNNSNNNKYYTSDDTDTDTERLMTNYASYDSVGRRATVHQRGVPSVTKRSNDTCDDSESANDNMCRGDHAADPSKGDPGDNDNYSGERRTEAHAEAARHSEGETSIDQAQRDSSSSVDTTPSSSDGRVVDGQSDTTSGDEASCSPEENRPGQRLLRGEPVIVGRVIKELCSLLDYDHRGLDEALVNVVAMTVNKLAVCRHILYQVFRYANHFATMYSDAAALLGDRRLDRRAISRMEQGLIGRGSLPQLAASFESVGVKLGLSGLTYGCRAVAYQLLNLLAELETAETAETTADELLTSIVSGGRDTEMLRRLLVDFLDPDGYTRADIPEQGDYDQVAYWGDSCQGRALPVEPWSRPRHNNTKCAVTSINNNNMAPPSEGSIKGIIKDLNDVKGMANDAVKGSRKIKAEGAMLYGKDNELRESKSDTVSAALGAWQRRVQDYVTQRGTAVTVPESQRRKTISISYRLTTSYGDLRRHLPTWVGYVLLVFMATACIGFEVGCVMVGSGLGTDGGHFWSIATVASILVDIILLQPLKVLFIAGIFTSLKRLL